VTLINHQSMVEILMINLFSDHRFHQVSTRLTEVGCYCLKNSSTESLTNFTRIKASLQHVLWSTSSGSTIAVSIIYFTPLHFMGISLDFTLRPMGFGSFFWMLNCLPVQLLAIQGSIPMAFLSSSEAFKARLPCTHIG
jgi:hypothetical protein